MPRFPDNASLEDGAKVIRANMSEAGLGEAYKSGDPELLAKAEGRAIVAGMFGDDELYILNLPTD